MDWIAKNLKPMRLFCLFDSIGVKLEAHSTFFNSRFLGRLSRLTNYTFRSHFETKIAVKAVRDIPYEEQFDTVHMYCCMYIGMAAPIGRNSRYCYCKWMSANMRSHHRRILPFDHTIHSANTYKKCTISVICWKICNMQYEPNMKKYAMQNSRNLRVLISRYQSQLSFRTTYEANQNMQLHKIPR